MKFKLYDTLSRKKSVFKPIKETEVGMYVCGATVNDVPHLGHARQQVVFDVLRRYLMFLGYNVKFVSNITDIDDKIINRARELGENITAFSQRNLKAHLSDYEKIGVEKPDIQPKATEYVKEMIELVQILEEKNFAYVIPNYGVYFDISRFEDYGKLSHQDISELLAGARVDSKENKRNKEDFVLWKFSKPGEPKWNSSWGAGRPGWHIECSAMSATLLGLPFDIHGGGQDLIFPHHEDEIAQSEAGYGKKMANFWVHNGMINVDKVKMSKSLGNFKTIRDLLVYYTGEVIRFFVISTHYRKPMDFSENSLKDTENSYNRLKNLALEVKDDGEENSSYLNGFKNAMNDDLNTPLAVSVLWALLRDNTAKGKYQAIKKIDSVFNLKLLEKEKFVVPEEVLLLVEKREASRKKKHWQLADEIRTQIQEKGFCVNDTLEGPRITKLKD